MSIPFPAEEQPMPAADLPTHQSPGYILESDPEEDPEEDDEEDPEEDPTDYPADRGDDRDDEESSDDDDEQGVALSFLLTLHLLLIYTTRTHTLLIYASPLGCPTYPMRHTVPLQGSLLRDCYLPTPPPSLSLHNHPTSSDTSFAITYTTTTIPQWPYIYTIMSDSEHSTVTYTSVSKDDLYMGSPGVEGPIFELLKSDHRRQRHLVETLKIVKNLKTQMIELQRQRGPAKDLAEPELSEEATSAYVGDNFGIRAAGMRQRDALPVHETEMPEMCLPLRNEACRISGPGCEGREEFGSCAVGNHIFHLDDARYDRALLRARVNRLDSDRPFHRRTALLIEEEARLSRAAWARSMDACDQVHSEGISLRTTVMAQQSEITELQAADRRRQAVITDLLKADYRRQRQLVETLKIVKSLKAQMIELQRQQGPAKDPAEPELPEEAGSST
ncbi:hypothetical protein Tco_0523771 [Tanacetum coccineum]